MSKFDLDVRSLLKLVTSDPFLMPRLQGAAQEQSELRDPDLITRGALRIVDVTGLRFPEGRWVPLQVDPDEDPDDGDEIIETRLQVRVVCDVEPPPPDPELQLETESEDPPGIELDSDTEDAPGVELSAEG